MVSMSPIMSSGDATESVSLTGTGTFEQSSFNREKLGTIKEKNIEESVTINRHIAYNPKSVFYHKRQASRNSLKNELKPVVEASCETP